MDAQSLDHLKRLYTDLSIVFMTAEATFQNLDQLRDTCFGKAFRIQVEEAAVQYPDHAGIQAFLAHLALTQGDIAKARDILARFPNSPDWEVRCATAELLAVDGKLDEAVDIAQTRLRDDPHSPWALTILLADAVFRGSQPQLENALNIAERNGPNHAALMYRCCKVWLSIGNQERAESILSRFRGHPSPYFDEFEAVLFRAKHDWSEAERLGRRAIDKHDEFSPAFGLISYLKATAGDLAEAKTMGYRAFELNSRSPQALIALSLVARFESNPEKAKELEVQAEAVTENSTSFFDIRRASEHFRKGEIEAAYDLFRSLIHDPRYMVSRRACEVVLRHIKSIPETTNPQKWFRDIESLGFDGPILYSAKARVATLDRKIGDAQNFLEQGLAKYPHDLDLAIAKLGLLDEMGEKKAYTEFANNLFPVVEKSPLALTKVLIELAGHKDDELTERFHQTLRTRFPNAAQNNIISGLRDINSGHAKQGFEKMNVLKEGFGINRSMTIKYARKRVLKRMPLWRRILAKMGFRK